MGPEAAGAAVAEEVGAAGADEPAGGEISGEREVTDGDDVAADGALVETCGGAGGDADASGADGAAESSGVTGAWDGTAGTTDGAAVLTDPDVVPDPSVGGAGARRKKKYTATARSAANRKIRINAARR